MSLLFRCFSVGSLYLRTLHLPPWEAWEWARSPLSSSCPRTTCRAGGQARQQLSHFSSRQKAANLKDQQWPEAATSPSAAFRTLLYAHTAHPSHPGDAPPMQHLPIYYTSEPRIFPTSCLIRKGQNYTWWRLIRTICARLRCHLVCRI